MGKYEDDDIEINEAAFDKDFDEIGWNPEVVDDSDEEAAKLYGY